MATTQYMKKKLALGLDSATFSFLCRIWQKGNGLEIRLRVGAAGHNNT